MKTRYALISMCMLLFLCSSVVISAAGNNMIQPVTNSPNNYSSAPKVTVLDDKGEPITEAEIQAHIINDYRTGCCLLGGTIGSSLSFLLGCVAGAYVYNYSVTDEGALVAVWLSVWGVGTGVSAWGSYKYGKEVDRRKAIELIKEERRTGIKQPLPERNFTIKVIMGLLIAGTVAGVYAVLSD